MGGIDPVGNRDLIRAAYLGSITRTRSAHARSFSVILLLLLSLVPADLTDILASSLNIRSAVGLLRRFLPQTKSTLIGVVAFPENGRCAQLERSAWGI